MNNAEYLRANQPLLLWALVVMLALLSCFVHVLTAHVERGAQWRASFGAVPPAPRVAVDRHERPRQPVVTRTAQR